MPLLLLAVALCPVERHDANGVRLAEQRWVAAIEARDAPALACRLASGFVDTTWQGKLRQRDAILAALPARPPSRLELSEISVRVIGNAAIVRGLNTQRAPDGAIVGQVRVTDMLAYREHRWQAITAQETVAAATR